MTGEQAAGCSIRDTVEMLIMQKVIMQISHNAKLLASTKIKVCIQVNTNLDLIMQICNNAKD